MSSVTPRWRAVRLPSLIAAKSACGVSARRKTKLSADGPVLTMIAHVSETSPPWADPHVSHPSGVTQE